MFLFSVAFASSCGVSALLIDCAQYGADEPGVAGNCLDVHESNVHESAVSLDVVVGVDGVLCEHHGSSSLRAKG